MQKKTPKRKRGPFTTLNIIKKVSKLDWPRLLLIYQWIKSHVWLNHLFLDINKKGGEGNLKNINTTKRVFSCRKCFQSVKVSIIQLFAWPISWRKSYEGGLLSDESHSHKYKTDCSFCVSTCWVFCIKRAKNSKRLAWRLIKKGKSSIIFAE